MKKMYLLGLLLALSLSLSAQNYSFFENDVRLINGNETVNLTHFGEFSLTNHFGITDYVSVDNSRLNGSEGELLLGLYYKPNDKFTFSLLVGQETLTKNIRFGGLAYYKNGDKLLISGFYQRNKSPFEGKSNANEWYDLQIKLALLSHDKTSLYVGSRYEKGYGLGLPVGLRHSIGSNNLYVVYTTYYNFEGPKDLFVPTFGLNFEIL